MSQNQQSGEPAFVLPSWGIFSLIIVGVLLWKWRIPHVACYLFEDDDYINQS